MLTLKLNHWPPTENDRAELADRGYRIVEVLDATEQVLVEPTIQSLASTDPVVQQIQAKVLVATVDDVVAAEADFPVKAFMNDAAVLTRSRQLASLFDGTGRDIIVAIVDTGIDDMHPGFAGRVTHAYDATGEGVTDFHGHGTHVAGIVGLNGYGDYRGMAPQCLLRSYKVLGRNGSGSATGIVRAINRAISDQVHVINMSLGGSSPGVRDQITDAVDAAVRAGITVVVASGNEGPEEPFDNSPAKSLAAITVGATTKTDQVADFSSSGITDDQFIKPDVSAPGVDIVSARAAGTTMGSPVDDHLTSASGTSMATPVVAGIVAQMLSIDPTLSPLQVKARLMYRADGIDGPEHGTGRVDGFAAYDGGPIADDLGRTRKFLLAPEPAPEPTPEPSPCVRLLAEALADPAVQDIVKMVTTHIRAVYRSGGSIPALDKLAAAGQQIAETARTLSR